MTYQQNKENKEHVSDKVDRPKNPVSAVDGVIVKVSKNNPELCEAAGKGQGIHLVMLYLSIRYFLPSHCSNRLLHALDKGAERFDLCPEEQISKLSVGEEHDEEHDGEA